MAAVRRQNIHQLASRVLAAGLVGMRLLHGDPDELVADGVHALINPSGLGHMIGLDVHDMEALGEDRVGYAPGQQRSMQFGFNHLRLAKPLQKGMVVTVEPGLYIIGPLIERWRAERRFDKRINYARLEARVGFGGIRIEDNVLVEADGARILGPFIPRDAEEAEAEMECDFA